MKYIKEEFEKDFTSMRLHDVALKYNTNDCVILATARNFGIKRPKQERIYLGPFKETTEKGKYIISKMVYAEKSVADISDVTGIIASAISSAFHGRRGFSKKNWGAILKTFGITENTPEYEHFFTLKG